jgi:hypothetical protein
MKRILLMLGLFAAAAFFVLADGGGDNDEEGGKCKVHGDSYTGNLGTSKIRISQNGTKLNPKLNDFGSGDDDDEGTPKCPKATDGTQLVLGTGVENCKCVCPGTNQPPTVTKTSGTGHDKDEEKTTTACANCSSQTVYVGHGSVGSVTWTPVQESGTSPNCVCPAGTPLGNMNPPRAPITQKTGPGGTIGPNDPPNGFSCGNAG